MLWKSSAGVDGMVNPHSSLERKCGLLQANLRGGSFLTLYALLTRRQYICEEGNSLRSFCLEETTVPCLGGLSRIPRFVRQS